MVGYLSWVWGQPEVERLVADQGRKGLGRIQNWFVPRYLDRDEGHDLWGFTDLWVSRSGIRNAEVWKAGLKSRKVNSSLLVTNSRPGILAGSLQALPHLIYILFHR